ncbi:hypothetical protein [Myxococcus stipitatus]|uniref:hypothetical protein n=1 Tax=Myxococcus stipitatus TaxID=83455 RepID=UPI0030D4567E
MSLLLILALLGMAGVVFAVVRSRSSGPSSEEADSSSKVDLPAPAPRPQAPVEGLNMRFTFLTPGGPSVMEADMRELTKGPFHPLSMLLLMATKLVALKTDAAP